MRDVGYLANGYIHGYTGNVTKDNATASRTRRTGPGVYATPDGWEVRHAYAAGTDGDPVHDGWHLIDADGEWVNHFPTKADALDAHDRINGKDGEA